MADTRVTRRVLRGPGRWACGLVSLAASTSGGFAVFTSENQAGTVALLGIGAASGLFSLLGVVPLKFAVGGAEVDLTYEEENAVGDVAESVPVEARPQMVDRLLSANLMSTLTPASSALLAAMVVERTGESRFAEFARRNPAWKWEPNVRIQTGEYRGRQLDGRLTFDTTGAQVAVEFKSFTDEKRYLRWIRAEGLALRDEVQARGLLLVVPEVSDAVRRGTSAKYPRVAIVTPADTDVDLRTTLDSLVK